LKDDVNFCFLISSSEKKIMQQVATKGMIFKCNEYKEFSSKKKNEKKIKHKDE
jgi:hypothetical protein